MVSHKISIHRANLFKPKPNGISRIATNKARDLFAVLRSESVGRKAHLIEIYNRRQYLIAKFIDTAGINDVYWVDGTTFLTVTQDATINIYSTKKGRLMSSFTTDYGPILCCKVLREELLITGTEYGYIATYKIANKTVEPDSRLVKVGTPITHIETNYKKFRVKKRKRKSPEKTEPGKRKRSNSENNSDSDDDDSEEETPQNGQTNEPTGVFSRHKMSIYGVSGGLVNIWDYHKKNIIDTIHVVDEPNTVNAIEKIADADLIFGDSTGSVSIYDLHSLTCKQTSKVFNSQILTVAKDKTGRLLYVSGQDSKIAIMKRNQFNSVYAVSEKIDYHANQVTSLIDIDGRNFYSGSFDGLFVQYNYRQVSEESRYHRVLNRYAVLPEFSNQISFSNGEMMAHDRKSLEIRKLAEPKKQSSQDASIIPEPVQVITSKLSSHIFASSHCEDWVACSTKRNLRLYQRQEDAEGRHTMLPRMLSEELPPCHILKFCPKNGYLAACSQNIMYLVDLQEPEDTESSPEDDDTGQPKLKVLERYTFKSFIQTVTDYSTKNLLIVGCNSSDGKSTLNAISLDRKSTEDHLKFTTSIRLPGNLSHVGYSESNRKDKHLYLYTYKNSIIKLDFLALSGEEIREKVKAAEPIEGLSDKTVILGMVILPKNHCIVYDSCNMYKVDLGSNKVVAHKEDYKFIIKMDNSAFGKSDQVILAELTPIDYKSSLPASAKRHFGKR